MCCYYSKEATDQLREEMEAAGGKITLWAVYAVHGEHLVSPLKRQWVDKSGWVKSNRKSVEYNGAHEDWSSCDPAIAKGKHVICKEADARRYVRQIPNTYDVAAGPYVAVPVTCHLRDLIGAGAGYLQHRDYRLTAAWEGPTAVFTKVRLLKKGFLAAIKKGKGE